MHWISPRESAGFRTLLASMAPSAPPAPTSVCNSSMNKIMFLARRTSFMTALMRSSNWPRYLVPATIIAKSSTTSRLSCKRSGTSCEIICCARPSTIAVFPTPASPRRTGLFLVRRHNTWTNLSISLKRPITGSSSPARASSVRSRPNESKAGVLLLPRRPVAAGASPEPGSAVASACCGFSCSLSPPAPSKFSTSSRTSSSFMPRFNNTCAATPSCSRSRPRSRCSVPT